MVSDLDKLDLAKQVGELQEKVKEMEDEAIAKDRPARDEVRNLKYTVTVCVTDFP